MQYEKKTMIEDPTSRTRTVLLVDEDPTVGEAIAIALGHKGITFYFALGVEDAMQVVAEHRAELNLVVADVEPRGHALALSSAIKSQGAALRMIVLGSAENLKTHSAALSQTPCKTMRMPIDFEELWAGMAGIDAAAEDASVISRETSPGRQTTPCD